MLLITGCLIKRCSRLLPSNLESLHLVPQNKCQQSLQEVTTSSALQEVTTSNQQRLQGTGTNRAAGMQTSPGIDNHVKLHVHRCQGNVHVHLYIFEVHKPIFPSALTASFLGISSFRGENESFWEWIVPLIFLAT